ncbi:LysE family translocator [Desulforhopalus vacuolatus]|uniref:LysE family translocator n=1 Tax=Desulforhopalus vacuolatus TaxID=40414 RepID=UPI0019664C6D|nr:LysE family translocator [Desulforhopalus vacuolatus]MBM9519379.1 LysE family translocator [Desulforhopalus vacuolatus]
MTFSDWLSLFAVALLGAMSPGPSLAVVVRNTLGGGRLNGVLTAWSHACGICIYALLTVLGLAIVLKNIPILFHCIGIAGACYLAWLGWKALHSRGGISATLTEGKQQRPLEAMRDGIMISALNPKIGLFFLALFSQVVSQETTTAGKFLTVLTPVITDGGWYTFVVVIISSGKILEMLRARAVLIDRITGVVLIVVAVKIVFSF